MNSFARTSIFAATFLMFFGLVCPSPTPAQQKPNVIFIMGDDIGWANIGVYNQGIMARRTPNLDRRASEGMRFTDYYAEASCPALASPCFANLTASLTFLDGQPET